MEDPPLVVVPPPKRSISPSPNDDDVLPGCKKSRLEDVVPVTPTDTNPSPLDLNGNHNDSNSSNDSVTIDSIPETKAPSPVSVVAIDFDSAMANEDDSEVEEIETGGLDTTIDLSEEDEEKEGGSSSGSDSSDEVAVIKEKIKPVPKRNRRKATNQRRNIKELMGPEHLDVATLAAQKEEWARRERIAAKQKSLGMASLPLSMEQIMERFSSASSVVSVTQLGGPDSDKSKKVSTSPPISLSAEHEVLTLSSDDEDCVPCYESNNYPSQKHQRDEHLLHPPPLLDMSRHYDSYVSDTSRSRYSGGTMIINNRDKSEVTFGDELEESDEKSPEEIVEEEDDDDDCVVLSPPPADSLDDDKDEDAYNVPDELGRVLVNVGHPPEEPDIFLAPQIARAVKPHQIGGIRFMYDNIVESLERYNNSPGFGCILAHSMGLGKTIQAAAFCDIFLNYTGANRVLVIVPINTIQNWLNEFNVWLPSGKATPSTSHTPSPAPTPSGGKKRGRKAKVKVDIQQQQEEKMDDTTTGSFSPETSHSSGEDGDEIPKTTPKPEDSQSQYRNFEIFLLNETVKNLAARAKIIDDWAEKRGVLLIGYEMYRMLALKRLRKTGKRKKSFIDLQNEDKTAFEEEMALDRIYRILVDPGPDLVICDEGHKIKNSGASISQALKAIRTRRRIVLTGYPLQNNLMEYHCMCDFIRPNYLGNKAEFGNMFERPIINGQCIDSTPSDRRLMQFRSHVLHSLVEGFVQRRSHLVLQRALPRKEEWVFLVKMSPIQTLLYKEFITYIRFQAEVGTSPPNPIKAFAICCKIWNHPDVLYNAVAKKDKLNEQAMLEDLEDLAEEVEFKRKRGGCRKKGSEGSTSLINGFVSPEQEEEDSFLGSSSHSSWTNGNTARAGKEKDGESAFNFEWSLNAFKGYVPNVLENGTKFELLFIIIQETLNAGDKLLVFSQSLLTLNLMEMFLSMRLQWAKGKEYFRLDGSTTGLERERLIKEFNKNPDIHVFLVSTRAGSLGINLIGANRVIVFDASWNPCHDCQAVCRIYRYGQKKKCQIYRFVTDCTLEKKIYDRQITKRGMANRVVDEMNPDAHFSTKDLSGSLLLELDDMVKVQDVIVEHDPSRFDDPVVQQLLQHGGDKITKAPFEHESLLIDRKEKKLSKAERRLALRNYELEKKSILNQGLSPPTSGRGSISYGAYPRPEYSHNVPIAPAPPGWTGMKGFASSPIYRNQSNNYGGGGGGSGGYSSSPVYFPPDSRESTFGLPRNISPQQLKKNGISIQAIALKKDSFLADPDGGPDIYLMAGQKVYLFRTNRGAYLKLSTGRLVAVRNRLRGSAQAILDTIPPSQDLTKEQVYAVIHSILRPKISSILSSSSGRGSTDFTSNRFFPPSSSSPVPPSPSCLPEFGGGGSSSISLPPIPSSYSYGDFQNQLQITNHRNSSGGDVTIWKKDRTTTSPSSTTTRSSDGGREDLIPDIEVIKINPAGENERIEPTQLESELFRHQNPSSSATTGPSDGSFNNPFPSYLGGGNGGSGGIYPQINEVNAIVDALARGGMSSSKYKDLYYQQHQPSSSSTSAGGRTNSMHGQYRNTQSPLDHLRNTVSQLPNYKLPDDLVMDYVPTSPSSASNSPRNSIPDSLYSKLLKSQQALHSTTTTTSPNPQQFNSQPFSSSSSSSHQFFSPPHFDPSMYSTNRGGGGSNSFQSYYTNGGSVSVNEKPAKSIFTPVEQEILDRHRKELL